MLALLAAACASRTQRPESGLPPVEDHGAAPPSNPVEGPSGPGAISPPPETLNASPIESPVVLALLDEAESQRQRGRPDGASAALERALRVAPGDALVWHRIAQLRLEQGQWQQAIVFARKSDSLAPSDPALQRANAILIERASQGLRRRN